MTDELNKLSLKKQDLIRQYDSKEITEDEYNNKMSDVLAKIDYFTKQIINEQIDKIKEEVPKGRKPVDDSYTQLIITILKSDAIEDIEMAADAIDDIKPGRKRKRNIEHTREIIRFVKYKPVGRWQKYKWNEDKFMLNEVDKK